MRNPLALAELAESVLNCVCAELNLVAEQLGDGHPGCPCQTLVAPGSPVGDCCGEGLCDETNHGQLAVWIPRIFATNNFPQQNPTLDPCAPKVMVAEVAVRLVRCGPTFSSSGDVPSSDEWTAASALVLVDMMAMFQAVTCCATEWTGHHKRRRVSIISHTPVAPEACVGSELRAYFDAGQIGGTAPVPS